MMAASPTPLSDMTVEGGNAPDLAPGDFKLRWSLLPFGDRFKLTLNDGRHETIMLLSPTELRKFRDRSTACLGEGRAVRKRLRGHRHEKA
jgi:hypothetical protein